MANLVNEINNSECRQIIQSWKINSGTTLKEIAKKLGIQHSAVSPWFSNGSKQAKPMPVNRAMELKSHYPKFPLQEYLRSLIDFHEEYNPADEKLSGIYAFMEAYGEIIGFGYWAQELKEYLSVITEVENLFGTSLPTTLTDEQKDTLRRALQEIMLKERDYEDSAITTLVKGAI